MLESKKGTIRSSGSILESEILTAGYCTHAEWAVLPNSPTPFRKRKFPATVAYFKHPMHGHILYDTGYSKHFLKATNAFPESLYRKATPVFFNENESASAQLQKLGVSADQVNYIILSHFHGDHIGGIKDFSAAKFICSREGYQAIRGYSRLRGLVNGYLKALLPEDFEERSLFMEDYPLESLHELAPYFASGIDVFKDGSMVLVPLPGHAHGHVGLYVKTMQRGQFARSFFIGDAAWTQESYVENHPPSRVSGIITKNFSQYKETLRRLHELYRAQPDLRIVACHCSGER